MTFYCRGVSPYFTAIAWFAALWIAGNAQAQPAARYEDARLLRVAVKTQAQLESLERSGAVILNCVPGVGPMDVVVTAQQHAELERLGLAVELLQDDVQAWIETEVGSVARAGPFEDYFLGYHAYGDASTVGSIVWYLNELALRYPGLASLFSVGTTLEGRTIWGLRVSNDAVTDKPAVIYFGAEHAREWVTATVPPYVATYLLENYGIDETATDLVDNVEFFLVPVFNVDGYVYTWSTERFWRKNRRYNGNGTYGVDLNRNWAEGWGGEGSSGSTSSEIYRGPTPFSEPETQALRNFFQAHPNIRAQLDIHSYSELILWPYGYTSALSPDHQVYSEVGMAMQSLIEGVHGHHYAAGPVYTTIYPASGVSVDWTYSQLGVLSYSFELRPTSGGLNAFALPADQIIPNNEEILPAMLHLTNSDWVRLPVRIALPDGLPATLTAGTDTPIAVELIAQSSSPVEGSGRLFYRYDSTAPFSDVLLSPQGGDSYLGVLPATNCTSDPQFYFQVTSTSGSVITSPRNAPQEGVYSAEVITGSTVFYDQPLNSNPPWTRQGLWSWGQPFGGGGEHGGPDPVSGHTGNAVLGYNLLGDYDNNTPPYHLTSSPVDCTGRSGVHLSFWRWLGVEQPAYDHASVSVSTNNVDWITVWQNEGEVTDTSWVPQDIDISAVADNQPTVYLRWTMGPTDEAWRYCGWNIDDIQLRELLCSAITGDYNGDGQINDADYTAFTTCFSGNGVPAPPGCVIFDFNADGDVDCSDWLSFIRAWTAPGDLPTLSACDAFRPPSVDAFLKNRYVSFIPGGSEGASQAFRITVLSNHFLPETQGRQMWVGPPDANGLSRVGCMPVFRNWGYDLLDVADALVAPGATFAIEATMDGTSFLPPVAVSTVPLWADVVGRYENGAWQPPNGRVELADVLGMLGVFARLPSAPPLSWSDIAPDTPDGAVDVLDIVHVLRAFSALPYPFAAPAPCP